ncbi:MAG: hypothetical protein Q8P90_01735 [bacterium]|nr:hypothetical protein [bacterium]
MLSFLSKYAHPFEKQVDTFFKHISSTSDPQKVHKSIERLLQKNVVVVNLWMEKRFKNYRYLSNAKRKKLYANTETIVEAFIKFQEAHKSNPDNLHQIFITHQVSYPEQYSEHLAYIDAIMNFLKPGGNYHYIKSATFGKLLQNPAQGKLTGDCNQIVTLYVYLYSLKYPITDLQIKILPEHVCLHFKGIDIEATTATFTKYTEFDYTAPISELLSVNLLDVSDFRETTATISEHSIVKSAELAYTVSSMRELVTRNLRISYHNLALVTTERKNFKTAMFYAKKNGDQKLLEYVNYRATMHYVENKMYDKARYYAKQSGDAKLNSFVITNEANRYLKKGSYKKARGIYQKVGDARMVQVTYQQEYNSLVKTVQALKTVEQMKKRKTTYRTLLQLAQKGGLSEQMNQIRNVLKQL